MRIVAFFGGLLKSAWGKIEHHSVGLCWMLGTLSVCLVYFTIQEIKAGNERLNHLVEKASMTRTLKDADDYIKVQHKNMFLMEKALQNQQRMLKEQDAVIRTLIDRMNKMRDPRNWADNRQNDI